MRMIRAIIRPEAVDKVADNLEAGGFTALTRIEVFGRGKQKGIKVVTYDADAEPDARDFFVNQATPEGIDAAKDQITSILRQRRHIPRTVVK